MFLSERIDRAIERATVLHGEQKRKITEAPYIVHPYAVAFLLAHFSDDEDVIIAGLLHDVLEDVPGYTYDMLCEEFGERVANIVQEVTEDLTEAEQEDFTLRKENWKERKDKYLANLQDDSHEALLIAAADKIHNMRSLISGFQKGGPSVMKGFNANREGFLWFHGEVVKIVQAKLPEHPLTLELQRSFESLEEALSA